MPKRKTMTAAEQAEQFRLKEEKRVKAGMLPSEDQDAAIDAMIRKNIKDYGA
jgi:hypothetical protein